MMTSNTKDFQYQSMRSQHNNFINSDHHPNTGEDDVDDNEDALSFRDLPIYNVDDSLQRARTDHNHTNNNNESGSFEFFSTEYTLSSTPENIIFCGRIIATTSDESPSGSPDQELPKHSSSSRSGQLLHWINPTSYSLLNSSSNSTKTAKDKQMKGRRKTLHSTKTEGNLPLSSSSTLRKQKPVTLCPSYGIVRLPPSEMNLNEIRRRHGRASPRSYLELYKEEQQRKRSNVTMIMTPRPAAAGFTGMIRSFSCRDCRSTSTII